MEATFGAPRSQGEVSEGTDVFHLRERSPSAGTEGYGAKSAALEKLARLDERIAELLPEVERL
eukprot:CAMPEP_0181504598 /NCGR_PEP_ID=MMETSP1110-20121109/57598_1 /TAXON_ID=174948 /ORGANISM="Symbiodinium sp., Strain CCMP421" /LENGTH=62 /DNA_ID=CAMNT_0023633503 /DNA_START=1 /DNA_END=186 /DNA_ORIENTATION=-